MTRILVDTSALIAHLDADDPRRPAVAAALLAHAEDDLVTHGYVIAESLAVVRRRFGPAGAATLIDDVLPSLEVLPVAEATFRAALDAVRATVPSATSFVDRITIAVAEAERIDTILALDPDLAGPGRVVLPA